MAFLLESIYLLFCVACISCDFVVPPRDKADGATTLADVEAQVDELLARMTLTEKLGQLSQLDGNVNGWPQGHSYQELYHLAQTGQIGSVLNILGAKNTNTLQAAAMDSRLKIPLIFGFDVIHGHRTLFPIPLGETASWDLEGAELAASIAAEEARSVGLHWTFAPMMDVARDPRWGRVMEGSGEDVYLGSKFAQARVRGFQGDDFGNPKKLIACAKHFAGYGASEAGKDYNGVDISERRLRELYLPPFKASVDMNVGTFMTAFNDLNGIPASGNKWLLTDILRGEWKWDGLVVSDYRAVQEMINHGFASDRSEAARYGLNAGCDMEMMERTYNQHGEALVNQSKVSMETIDTAVKNVLRAKFRLKLWDNLYVDEKLEARTLLKPEFKQAARVAAQTSFVLLKNDPYNGGSKVLPISKDTPKKILVVGALADDNAQTLDWWPGNAKAADSITILQGIRDHFNDNPHIQVSFSRGCEIRCPSNSEFAETARLAEQSDVVVLVVGETREISGEGGSRAEIDLPGHQVDLVKAIHATGKPYVVVLKNGRPMTIEWIAENSPAILVTWHSGTMGGVAVADVLFGDVNPSGKLPMTFPRSVGQIPIHYDRKSSGRPFNGSSERYVVRYIDFPVTPRYPFGFGLSYTTFNYSHLVLDKETYANGENVLVTVTVKNTGDRSGVEIVQLYIRDIYASITRPLRELKGFRRLEIAAGASVDVQFTLGPEELGFLNANWVKIVEAGEFEVFVGGDSYASLSKKFTVV